MLGLALLVALAAGSIYAAGMAGVGSERLRMEAQKAVSALAGYEIGAEIGHTRLVPSISGLVALEIHDARLIKVDTGETILDAGRMRFGVKLGQLLRGQLRLGSAEIANARITPADRDSGDRRNWVGALRNSTGLLDPDRIVSSIFSGLRRAFDIVGSGGAERLRLENVSLAAPGNRSEGFAIESLRIRRSARHEISLDGTATFRQRRLTLQGTAIRAAGSRQIERLEIAASLPSIVGGQQPTTGTAPGEGLAPIVAADLKIEGTQTDGMTDRLSLEGSGRFDLGFGLAGDGEVRATLSEGTDAVIVERARLALGRSVYRMRGTIRPLAETPRFGPPAYAVEMFSRESIVAPGDSPEPALPVSARLAGRFSPDENRFTADLIQVRTSSGELAASAAATFEPGKTPGISLALSLSGMSTSHVKQLWPAFAASGAREWALANVFGGRVLNSNLRFRVPPGRLGNGVALNEDEITAHFEVEGTRFDVAGRIPPVRDGAGIIDVHGTDVNVTLRSGTVFMPSGRTMAARNGTLTIDDANLLPRIGKLGIDVEGEASAAVELASYEPINASRFHELAPEDVSGKVAGRVTADIPLQVEMPDQPLEWSVALDYENLALAKPMAGQIITEADGSMHVDPRRAEFDAEARLNGIPARVDITEPLGGSEIAPRRVVEMRLDDETRDRLVPGLSTILSGPASVTFRSGGGEGQDVSVDLTEATLSLPWVGWRKGAGVPGEASFLMETDGNVTALDDFTLEGQSFGAAGIIRLANGSLESARFDRARLNRGDSFSVNIRSSGGGYAIAVEGSALDARPVIKRFLSDPAETTETSGEGAAVPVSVEASLARASGFGGEQVSNVTLSYRGTGSDTASLQASAITDGGGEATVEDVTKDGARTLRVRSSDAGSILRFLDVYAHMEGGALDMALAGSAGGSLAGPAEVTDFWVVDEPRLRSLVTASPNAGANRRAGDLDPSRVSFELGSATMQKGSGYLAFEQGVLRGPRIGSTFQGTLYDAAGNISITGTFMPLYGVNRIFGEIPLFGQILGNGRDGGLIGITFRLIGKTSEPQLQVNPISAIAPGILREIFEYR